MFSSFFKKTVFTFAPTEIELTQNPSPITNQQSTVLNFDYLVTFFKKKDTPSLKNISWFSYFRMQSHPFFEDLYNLNHSMDSPPITG